MKWIAILATIALVIACFNTWVVVPSTFEYISITGLSAEKMKLGKPAYFHFFMAAVYLIFHFTPTIWAKRWNLLFAALNLGWAIRNFFLVSACAAGECPQKKWGLYVLLISSVIMMLAALFPKIELKKEQPTQAT